MRWYYLFIAFLCFCVTGFSQTNYYTISFEDQDAIENLIALPNASQDTIECAILQLLAEAKVNRDQPNDLSSLQKLYAALRLEERLEQQGAPSYHLFEYMGDFVSSINPAVAIEFYHKARNVVFTSKPVSRVMYYVLLTNMAGMYVKINHVDSAKYYFNQALFQAKDCNETTYASALNNFGVFYYGIHKADSASFYYNAALVHLDPDDDIILYCSIQDNIAQLEIDNNNFEAALPVYEYNDSVYFARNMATRYTINRLKLIRAYERTGDRDPGRLYKDLEEYVKNHPEAIREVEVLNFYKAASDFFLSKGDIKSHYYYLSTYRTIRDKRDERIAEYNHELTAGLLGLQAAALQKEIDFRQLQVAQQRKTLAMQRFMIMLSVFTSIIIILFMILYFRQKRKEHEIAERAISAELKNKEMEARLIQQELELKKKDLTNVVLHNAQVYDLNQKMIDKLSSINGKGVDIKDQIHSLILEIRGQTMVGDRAIAMQQQIDTVNAEFYEKLMKKYPDLTKAEEELCGYIRINLSSKDISILKKIEANSVKMGKNRLRKKLGVAAFGNLYSVIQNI